MQPLDLRQECVEEFHRRNFLLADLLRQVCSRKERQIGGMKHRFEDRKSNMQNWSKAATTKDTKVHEGKPSETFFAFLLRSCLYSSLGPEQVSRRQSAGGKSLFADPLVAEGLWPLSAAAERSLQELAACGGFAGSCLRAV